VIGMTVGPMWGADLAIALVSVGLTAWIFALYLKRAADVRSKFSFGLALLSGIFFVESITSVSVYYHFSTKYPVEVALPLLALSLLGLAGFAVLVWLARQ
jgi:hypothetical protein